MVSRLHRDRLDGNKSCAIARSRIFFGVVVRQHHVANCAFEQIEKCVVIDRVVKVQTLAGGFSARCVWWIDKERSGFVTREFR